MQQEVLGFLYYLPTQTLILKGVCGKDFHLKKGRVYFKENKLLEGKIKLKKIPRFSLFFGWVLRTLFVFKKGPRLSLGLFHFFPFPWAFFPFFYSLPLKNNLLKWETLPSDLPYEQWPLLYHEKKILEGEGQQKRIQFLVAHHLKRIDSREDGSSHLYIDKKLGRYWQHFSPEGESLSKLVEVTQPQWTYFYVEKKERKGHTSQSDKEFYEILEEDASGARCNEPGCDSVRVRFSELCQDHHFQYVTGRKIPHSGEEK